MFNYVSLLSSSVNLESSVGIFLVQLIFAITGQPNKELVGVRPPGLIKGKGNYGRNRFDLFPQVERTGRIGHFVVVRCGQK